MASALCHVQSWSAPSPLAPCRWHHVAWWGQARLTLFRPRPLSSCVALGWPLRVSEPVSSLCVCVCGGGRFQRHTCLVLCSREDGVRGAPQSLSSLSSLGRPSLQSPATRPARATRRALASPVAPRPHLLALRGRRASCPAPAPRGPLVVTQDAIVGRRLWAQLLLGLLGAGGDSGRPLRGPSASWQLRQPPPTPGPRCSERCGKQGRARRPPRCRWPADTRSSSGLSLSHTAPAAQVQTPGRPPEHPFQPVRA